MSLHTFTSFRGRIPRLDYWLGELTLLVFRILLYVLLRATLNFDDLTVAGSRQQAYARAVFAVFLLLLLLSFVATFALYAKRWHDRDKSGWWSLIMLVPIIGGLWQLIELGFLPGTEGDNRFGPDPADT